jgi:hypothetical protein
MKHVKNLFGKGLEILSTAFPSQLLIKIDQAMKINFGEFIKTHSLRFSLTGDRRDYILCNRYAFKINYDGEEGCKRWMIPNRVSPNSYPHLNWKDVGGKCGRG